MFQNGILMLLFSYFIFKNSDSAFGMKRVKNKILSFSVYFKGKSFTLYRVLVLFYLLCSIFTGRDFFLKANAIELSKLSEVEKLHVIQPPLQGREISIIMAPDGSYYPKSIHLETNQKVVFYLTNLKNETSCFRIREKNILVTLPSRKIVSLETTFTEIGTYLFNCPNHSKNKEQGFLYLTTKRERAPASVQDIKVLPSAPNVRYSKRSSFQNVIFPEPKEPWTPIDFHEEELLK